jgi:2-(1,2-epoxy-1,2-dihydrophenyl)acetyl-CoA isomerase
MTNPGDDGADLIVAISDGVAVLTLNRPERLNALSRPMLDAAIAALERCPDDAEVGCIVVTGAGRGFCAGGDVTADGRRLGERRLDRGAEG